MTPQPVDPQPAPTPTRHSHQNPNPPWTRCLQPFPLPVSPEPKAIFLPKETSVRGATLPSPTVPFSALIRLVPEGTEELISLVSKTVSRALHKLTSFWFPFCTPGYFLSVRFAGSSFLPLLYALAHPGTVLLALHSIP